MAQYTVFYTDETMIGNELGEWKISAPDLQTAFEFVSMEYPEAIIDSIVLTDNTYSAKGV